MSRIFADTSPPHNYSRDCRARGAGAVGGQHAAMACLCHRRSARWTTQSAAALLAPRMATDLPKGEGTDYTIYPEPLTEPYRSRRFSVGELLYRSINVSREDKSSRYKQYSRNYQFLAPRLSYFSHAKRLTDLHNGQISTIIFRPLPCWRAGSDCIPVRSGHGSLSTAQCVFFCDFPTI